MPKSSFTERDQLRPAGRVLEVRALAGASSLALRIQSVMASKGVEWMSESVSAPDRVRLLPRWAFRLAVLAGLGLGFWLTSASSASADDTPLLPVRSAVSTAADAPPVVPSVSEAIAPLPDPVVEPVVAPVRAHVVEPLVERVVASAVTTVVEPLVPVGAPVVDPLGPVVAPVNVAPVQLIVVPAGESAGAAHASGRPAPSASVTAAAPAAAVGAPVAAEI